MRDYALSHARSFETAGAASLIGRFIGNLRARRAVTRLDKLDDHILRDIGFTRGDVRWASGLPLSVNAAVALEERSVQRQRRINFD